MSRKNAMLTTEDRRWLTGEKGYEGEHAKQQRYQRRRDIRERVYNSLLDFTILFDHLEDEEREKLFERLRAEGEFTDGLRDALAFVLYNTGITETLTCGGGSPESTAERLLLDALYRVGRREDVLVERVELDVEARRAPLPSVLEELEAGEELSPAAVRLLVESDRIDADELQECIRRAVFDAE